MLSLLWVIACAAGTEKPPTAAEIPIPAASPPPIAPLPPNDSDADGTLPSATPAGTTGEIGASGADGTSDPAQVSTMLGKAAGVAYIGDWTSPACGGRTYARNVTFYPKQEYAVMEIIAPCPVGTQCLWSGLGTFAGLWGQQGTKLRVQEISMTQASPGGPHPVYFEATEDGRLVENGCFYTKGLTVPPGYTEEQVRAKIPGKKEVAPAAPVGTTAPL